MPLNVGWMNWRSKRIRMNRRRMYLEFSFESGCFQPDPQQCQNTSAIDR